jgi:hypothetical protein
MAKSAKFVEADLGEKRVQKFLKDVLGRYDAIEEARGRFMNTARREREAMTALYEGMAASGVSQKAARLNVKIVRAMEKIKGWIADAETEDRKMVERLAKAEKDKHQLALFADLPKQEKPKAADTNGSGAKAKAAKPKAKAKAKPFSEEIREAAGPTPLSRTEPVGNA